MSSTAPWLVVGLGNPGPRYAKNRHNVGFMVVERFVDGLAVPSGPVTWKDKFKAKVAAVTADIGRCVCVLPQTFMNCSGESVQPAAAFHKVPPPRIVVIHDELDFEFGRIAIKKGGGHGGHNGLRDIIEKIGSRDFLRIRFGIGRPGRGNHGDVSAWVLNDFPAIEAAELPDHIDTASSCIRALFEKGVGPAMNEFNVAEKPKPN